MLSLLGKRARAFAASSTPWTNVYGLARSLLALGTALTLTLTPTGHLFELGAGMKTVPICGGPASIGLFCQFPHHLEWTRWLALLALVVIASGWRPRGTALVHWWIAFSIQNNAVVRDGGDQVTLVLATLLLPVALTDRRKWHWSAPAELPVGPMPVREELRRWTASFALLLVRIQVAAIYFHAAIGKFGVEEWVDGTAVYYFFNNPSFGAVPGVLKLLTPILASPLGVCAITWGTLVLEYVLSAALFMPRRSRRPLLVAGLVFHGGIMVVHGLVSFGLAMFAALILYLRPNLRLGVLAGSSELRRPPSRSRTRDRGLTVQRRRDHVLALGSLLCGCSWTSRPTISSPSMNEKRTTRPSNGT
jgi:antimicrobial peptide system SdpB family protein